MADDDEVGLDRGELDRLLSEVRDGVVSRHQLVELGARAHKIRRLLRRRELVPVHPGVYVDHTGPPTQSQLEWAAVLCFWPSALSHRSALPSALPSARQDGVVHVAVGVRRTVASRPTVVVHRTADLGARTVTASSPPRIRIEHAVIDVASSRDDVVDQFRLLADVVQTRRTTAARIADVLRTRRGVRGGVLLLELLADLESGACSVLEREYLLLERRHGLTSLASASTTGAAVRQAAGQVRGGRVYRDVSYEGARTVVELDGRAFHDTAAARDQDALRDLETQVVDDVQTVRLTYAMVVRHGCRTMAQIAALLTRRGWTGSLTRCPACPDP